jgi:hypothetical protein
LNIKSPNLFIIGAAKAGTTALSNFLNRHEQIFMSENKEPNYFAKEALIKDKLYYDSEIVNNKEDYLSLFNSAKEERFTGEASVSYLFYSGTAKRIIEFSPKAKIIVILRNPIERAISHYLMDKRLGFVKPNLDEIITNREKYAAYYQQYVELGLYSTQLKEYIDIFDKKDILILNWKENILEYWEEIISFLGVNQSSRPELSRHNESGIPQNKLLASFYQSTAIRQAIKKITPNRTLRKIKGSKVFVKQEFQLEESLEQNLKELYSKDYRALLELGLKPNWKF